jgi:uncharacterized protein YvpB
MTRTRILGWAGALLLITILGAAALANPTVRNEAKVLLRLEPPPQITPLAVVLPAPRATPQPPRATPTPTSIPTATPTGTVAPSPTVLPSPTALPSSTPSPAPVIVGERAYTAYIPAAVKEGQRYQYTCEFDAAWVVLQTFGVDVTVDQIIARTPVDESIEPYFEETGDGFVIHGGDIRHAFSGNYRENFLARSSGGALVPVFASFGLTAAPVADRAAVEAALRRGALIWMKTTVDFKPWRPAVWITPDGSRLPTVLGNDHAVVVIGFNADVVVIRDVLGPTSTNWRRPQEYEVSWDTFLSSWGAQGFDGLAVEPAAS